MAATGQFTKRSLFVSYKGKVVATSLQDVRERAKKSFAVLCIHSFTSWSILRNPDSCNSYRLRSSILDFSCT